MKCQNPVLVAFASIVIVVSIPSWGQTVSNPCIKNDTSATFMSCTESGPRATSCTQGVNTNWTCAWTQILTEECLKIMNAQSGRQTSDPYSARCSYQSMTCGPTAPVCNPGPTVTVTYQCNREAGGACPGGGGGGGGENAPLEED